MTVDVSNQQVQIPSGVIPEQPDINTVELATYGDTYLDVKSAIYLIDMMIEVARRDCEKVVASCHGREYELVRSMLRRTPFIVSQERPHVENYEELMAARKARKVYRAESTVRTLEKWRVEVEAYGAMHGAFEYGQSMMESGVSADLMRRIFKKRASKGMTNSYASIRDMRDGRLMDGLTEEERSLTRMAEMILMANEYDRMEREYPEDDSSQRVEEEFAEKLRRIADTENEAGDEDDDEPVPFDRSVLWILPSHVGLGFRIDDDDDEVGPEVSEEGSDNVFVDEADPEMHESIGPAASTAEDAIAAVPEPERLRIGPGTSDEERFFLDSKYGRIERLGPMSSTPFDAMETVEDVLATFMPPAHPEDFARWYGRRLMRDHPSLGNVTVQDADDDGMVVIITKGEGSE